MKTSPMENSTWSRCALWYSGRYSVRSSTAPSNAVPTNAMGRHTRNGTPSRCISSTVMYPPAMAKAPCARLMKFINPMVTARPTARMNSSMP